MRRRSGHSTRSRGKRESPSWAHCASSSAARALSRTKWTARSSSGSSILAYCRARASARSSRSTKTRTTWRRKDRAHDGVADVLFQFPGLLFVLLVEPDQGRDKDDEQHDDDPDAFAKLHDHEDQHDAERQHGREPIDEELVFPPSSRYAQAALGHAGARHGEAGEDSRPCIRRPGRSPEPWSPR